MKLLHCRICGDIFNLTTDWQECTCKTSGGFYLEDYVTAKVYTSNRVTAVLLGFANSSFSIAMGDQLVRGDLPLGMPYGAKWYHQGVTLPLLLFQKVLLALSGTTQND